MSNDSGRTVIENKVVVLGHSGVGKTSLVNQYVRGTFQGNTTTTIGAAYTQKFIDIDNHRISLQIWDTAGQERFRSMLPMYYRNAQAAILVFDVTDPSTMDRLPDWVSELQSRGLPDIILTIASNKADVASAAPVSVSPDDAQRYANSIGASLFETSAKTGKGIEDLFNDLAQKLLDKHLASQSTERDNTSGGGVSLTDNSGQSGGRCC